MTALLAMMAAWRSMCGCALSSRPAAAAARSSIRAKPAVVNGGSKSAKPPSRQAQSPRELLTNPAHQTRKIGSLPSKVRIIETFVIAPCSEPIRGWSRYVGSRFNAECSSRPRPAARLTLLTP
jgi:hypothetical protein